MVSNILSNTNNYLNSSTWDLDGTLTGTISPSQCGTGINDKKEYSTSQTSRTRASPSDAVYWHNFFLATQWDALYDWLNLLWLQAETDSRLTVSHVGICIYHFTMPSISIQPHDCFHLFTQVHLVQRNLWLTAWSRVNMHHTDRESSIKVKLLF